ncbi:MAG: DUF2520 domain-containing protein [Mediterranea massiliensis]|nr:DUF2520 domain-containing protein [Mediterranea massiliensis]
MSRSVEDTSIVLVGAGNLATNLGKALYSKGFRIVQVFSRTETSAKALAQVVEAEYTTELSALFPNADLYIVALKDDAFLHLLPSMVLGKENALWIHTAGSLSVDVWQNYVQRCGVLYPMQTFSKMREVHFSQIPIFVEASTPSDTTLLKQIGSILSDKVYEATSLQRKSLHLAAVFACNFTNHMYALSAELLEKYNLPFEVMLPLIDETALKVHTLTPQEAQTGPAVRFDRQVMQKHQEMLSDFPTMQEIYCQLSENIHRLAVDNGSEFSDK